MESHLSGLKSAKSFSSPGTDSRVVVLIISRRRQLVLRSRKKEKRGEKGESELLFFKESFSLPTSSPKQQQKKKKLNNNKYSPFGDEEPPSARGGLHLQVPQARPEDAVDDRPRAQRLADRRVRQPHFVHRLRRERSTEFGDAALLFFPELAHEIRPGVELAEEAGDGGARGLVAGEELSVFFKGA